MTIPFWLTGALVVLLAGAPMVDPSVATAQAPPLPSSMAAIGDSFTVGFSTGAPDCLSGACSQWSWSTGTSSTSHYVRLLALDPGIAGHAINAAVPGAFMSGFVGQVATATSGGNQPGYATVLLGAADTCLGSAPTDVSVFTAQFRAGMDALFQSSPNARVLVASIFSPESIRSAVLADDPNATFTLCSSTFFNASDAARAAIMSRLQQFNAVLSTECATYANCKYDGGALFAHQWTRAEVSTVDNLHPSVTGQNMISTTLWNAGVWANGGSPFGGDDTGTIPPDAPKGPVTKCENGVGKAAGKLAGAIGKCIASEATGKLADAAAEDACEAAVLAKFDATKTAGCGGCTNLDTAGAAVAAVLDGNNDKIYCTAAGTAFGGDVTGNIPPDAPKGLIADCENRVNKAVGKLVASLVKCHASRATGKLADAAAEDACEGTALTKFGATKTSGCDPCTNLGTLGAFVETTVDGSNNLVYCASPSGALVE